jgi:hypothetical protein
MHVWPTVSRSVLRDFDPVYVANGSRSEELNVSISGPLVPPKAAVRAITAVVSFVPLVDHLLALSSPLR